MSKRKPKLVRCGKCWERVVDDGVGFQPRKVLKCGKFKIDVTPDDGCTFGEEGDSDYILKRKVSVTLDGHEKVWGHQLK